MVKEENKDASGYTIANGFQFGFGFFLANLAGFAIIGLIAWVIILISRTAGFVF